MTQTQFPASLEASLEHRKEEELVCGFRPWENRGRLCPLESGSCSLCVAQQQALKCVCPAPSYLEAGS